jgi:hypothetical protein
MKYFAPATNLVLTSRLKPDECAKRLQEAIDRDSVSFFSLSGSSGHKRFLGAVEDLKFRVFKRGYKNIPPVLRGAFCPSGRGTRVEGSFDLEMPSKIAICVFSFVGVLVIVPIFLYSLRERTVPPWLAILFLCVYVAGALLAPRIVRWNGLDQEREISDFLCEALEAYEEPSGRDLAPETHHVS